MFPVEPGLRAPGTAPVTQWVEFHSLEDVFPGSGLAAKFDEDGVFRAALPVVCPYLSFELKETKLHQVLCRECPRCLSGPGTDP